MSQINVNAPGPVEPVDNTGDRTAAAGINFLAVLVTLAVVVFLVAAVWWFFAANPIHINLNQPSQPAPQININPPAQQPSQPQQPPAQQPSTRP